MPSPFIGGRIPQDLHDALQKHITESGEKLPQILQKALSDYLSYTPTSDKNRVELEERVASLEASFKDLKDAFEQTRENPLMELLKGIEKTPPEHTSLFDTDNSTDNSTVIEQGETDSKSDINFDINEENTNETPDNKVDIINDINAVEAAISPDNNTDINVSEMTNEEVHSRTKVKLSTVRGYHYQKRDIVDKDKGLRYKPVGIKGHPRWTVEPDNQ